MTRLSEGWDKERQHACTKAWRGTPRGKYVDSRQNARRRGIEWFLSFDEWWAAWEPYWPERGRDGYMMCRKVEPGPYSVENIYIGTSSQNQIDRRRNEKETMNG